MAARVLVRVAHAGLSLMVLGVLVGAVTALVVSLLMPGRRTLPDVVAVVSTVPWAVALLGLVVAGVAGLLRVLVRPGHPPDA